MLSHLNKGQDSASMVDISGKDVTERIAVAECFVHLTEEIAALLDGNDIQTPKGPVFHTAMIAGTQATKRTAELIPLCHTIPLDSSKFSIVLLTDQPTVHITCRVKTTHKTGVEMEALTGASVAGLTIYDMCKAMSPDIVIDQVRLVSKTGGKSDFSRG